MSTQRPPALARWLLRIQPLGVRRAEVDADLLELYQARVESRGVRYAGWRYYCDVLSLWRVPRERESGTVTGTVALRGRGLDILQDLIYAGRMCRRTPGVVIVAVTGLGVAIGVSTSIFSIVNGIAFKPSGIDEPSSVIRIYRGSEGGYSSTWRYSEFDYFRNASPGIAVEGWLMERQPLSAPSDGGPGQSISAMFVTGGFLPALTTRVTAGRLLARGDDAPDAPPVAVVSHGYWIRQLGQDPGVVGRALKWNGVDVTVVGISAQGFRGTGESAPDLWVPIAAFPRLMGGSPLDIAASPIAVIARLAAGVTARQAEAQINAAVASLPPPVASDREWQRPQGVRLGSAEGTLPRSKRGAIVAALAIVTGVIALLLILGCVNVASLLVANGVARRRELGVRIALGASRARVVRQLMTESLSLGLLGGLAGTLIALWLLPVLTRAAGAPASLDVSMDARVLAFLVAVSVAAGLGAGVAPARHAANNDVSSVLKAGGRGGGPARQDRLRATLMGVQAAASIVLVVLAALLTRGWSRPRASTSALPPIACSLCARRSRQARTAGSRRAPSSVRRPNGSPRFQGSCRTRWRRSRRTEMPCGSRSSIVPTAGTPLPTTRPTPSTSPRSASGCFAAAPTPGRKSATRHVLPSSARRWPAISSPEKIPSVSHCRGSSKTKVTRSSSGSRRMRLPAGSESGVRRPSINQSAIGTQRES